MIKDYGRGLLVGGSNTFGKGTVQSIMPIKEAISRGFANIAWPDLGALKLTIQQFYRANGESTQVKGVAPDVKIPSLFDQIDEELEGKLDNSFKFDKVAAVNHDQFNRVPPDLLARLDARSEARRKESDKFRKLDAAIQKIVARKAKHLIPLSEAKYRAEVVSEDEEQDEIAKDKKAKRRKHYDRPAWESNYYNDEIINVVADYLTLGSKALAGAPVKVDVNQP